MIKAFFSIRQGGACCRSARLPEWTPYTLARMTSHNPAALRAARNAE